MGVERLHELQDAFQIGDTGNNEILFAWLEQAVYNNYADMYVKLEEFLVSVGRRKFLTPLYKAMLATDKTSLANSIYQKARGNYHAVAQQTMDKLLGV